jgi:hypothetical protein
VAEQQVQRYEANGYRSTRLARLCDIAEGTSTRSVAAVLQLCVASVEAGVIELSPRFGRRLKQLARPCCRTGDGSAISVSRG